MPGRRRLKNIFIDLQIDSCAATRQEHFASQSSVESTTKIVSMDTDDLSYETYKAVIETAERYHHDLACQFGLRSYGCNSDDDFLNGAEALIKRWLSENDLEFIIEDMFFNYIPGKAGFKRVLESILNNIAAVKEIPVNNRRFESW